jgi:uncharacterized protein (TIGR02996 family)
MSTEEDMLAGIVAHPGELERWLILADWLEDRGDPRAELTRLRFLLHTEPDHPDRTHRLARQQELLEQGLAAVVPTWTNALGIPFALLLPGSFWMGSPESQPERDADEQLHRVMLTHAFYLGVHPVTVGEFARFVAATGYQTEAEKSGGAHGYVGGRWQQDPSITWRTPGFAQTDRHPIVCVSWNDAQEMVAWLNQVEVSGELVYSLPTEARWEYACRAGTTTAYWWGNEASNMGEYAWFNEYSGDQTHPVESKKPNAWGLHDMHGNVWEWCLDWYGDYPSGDVTDPLGASGVSARIVRGGSSCFPSSECRAAYRRTFTPEERYYYLGFRLARVWVGE